MEPSIKTVSSVVQKASGLVEFPEGLTFYDLGLNSHQLQRIQIGLLKTFNRTVPTLKYSDTVISITNQLLKIKP